jgi:hypothetical protein
MPKASLRRAGMSKFNYFGVVTADGYAFPDEPQAIFGFNSQAFTFLNRGIHTVEYSFDGSTVHGDLNPADASNGLSFDNRVECKAWFRGADGYGAVRVEAWK